MGAVRVTSADVARLAGVSQSAVSRVFTPGASASAATAAKVREAAQVLGYRPDALARAMSTGRSRIVGLIVRHLGNQFYPAAVEALSNALQARGYHLLVFTADSAGARVPDIVREMLDYRVDGIVTASVALSSSLTERCTAAGIPIVLFNRGQEGARVSTVTSANRDGARAVADLLVRTGHRRIAHVAGWQGALTGRDRAAGLAEGLAAHDLAPIAVIDAGFHREAAMTAARRILDLPRPPDAIFAASDHMAMAVMDVARFERGLCVPRDLTVIGFDDVPMAAWPSYALTTVRQPLRRMVAQAVETLMAQIDDPARAPTHSALPAELILRATHRSRGA
ncbi:MAG: LacI family DNA-binding transcriptional regulator [Paracoccaceae bacterium]